MKKFINFVWTKGDRDSWKWNIKLDKNFSANIPYKEYKNKNVKLDKKLLKQFK